MKLRMKIMSGFLILALMLAAAGIFFICELVSIRSSVQSLLDDNYRSIDAARKMIEALGRANSGLLLSLSGHPEEGRRMAEEADGAFLAALETARNNLTLPNEKDFVGEIESRYDAYRGLWTQAPGGRPGPQGVEWYFSDGHAKYQAAIAAVDRLMALNDEAMYRTASELESRMRRVITPGIVAILSSLAFALLFNYFINLFFVGPLLRITRDVQEVLRTGKPSRLELEAGDELQELATAVRDLSRMVRTQP